jgi:hypothetical protein
MMEWILVVCWLASPDGASSYSNCAQELARYPNSQLCAEAMSQKQRGADKAWANAIAAGATAPNKKSEIYRCQQATE